MSSQFSFKNICLEIQTQKQGTKDYVLDSWNYQRDKKIKITIQITITEDDQIIYSHDGVILRVESVYHGIKNSIIFKNMEQILYLTWQSQNKFDKKKNGRWFASWNGNTLLNVGGYYQEGLRQGQWYELMKNFGSKAQVFEIGEYYNDLRTYKWIYIYNTKRISSGFYNNQGLKVGKWDELNDKFWGEAQIIYSGEYNMKGKKIGKWDILYCKKGEHQYKFIGGGSYDYFKHQKVGKWVELCEKFEYLNQVTYIGEYDQKGLKRGRWDTWFQEIIGKKDYKLMQILFPYRIIFKWRWII
ncbi:unnamed protein product [Paramecium sonneborni]|uniref:MORN repeat protein n=1 Tax=Paramecium sonneborni TaxID=65129 RepID=A0A8S1QWE8_9CILI|nr:unnamed protein product [Paramecium sonneborni]